MVWKGRMKRLLQDEYQCVEVLGKGGKGQVFKGRSKSTGEMFAVKAMKKGHLTVREFMCLQKLNHPNIIKMREFFFQGNAVYIVMELVDCNLCQYLERNNRGLPLVDIRRLCFQLLNAVNYTHRRGFCHRDIKPANVLISGDGGLKLADFGWACNMASKIQMREPRSSKAGTHFYRAPELLLGSAFYSYAADMWSVGVTAEMFCGSFLFYGRSVRHQLNVIHKAISSLKEEEEEERHDGLEPAKSIYFKSLDVCKHDDEEMGIVRMLRGTQANNDAVELIKSLLLWNSFGRPTANTALAHPFCSCFYSGESASASVANTEWSESSSSSRQGEDLLAGLDKEVMSSLGFMEC